MTGPGSGLGRFRGGVGFGGFAAGDAASLVPWTDSEAGAFWPSP